MLSFSAHESIQGSNRLNMFCGALLRRAIFNNGDQGSMAALEDNEYRPASTPRGMRAGSAPAPATPAYQAVVQHSPRLRRMVSHQGIPLPGMPRTTSLHPRPPSLQDQRTGDELHVHGTSDAYGPPLTGPGVQGLRMGSGGASLGGSRQARFHATCRSVKLGAQPAKAACRGPAMCHLVAGSRFRLTSSRCARTMHQLAWRIKCHRSMHATCLR